MNSYFLDKLKYPLGVLSALTVLFCFAVANPVASNSSNQHIGLAASENSYPENIQTERGCPHPPGQRADCDAVDGLPQSGEIGPETDSPVMLPVRPAIFYEAYSPVEEGARRLINI